jgi:hypothetical protein
MTPAGGPPDESRSLLMSAFERNAAVMSALPLKADFAVQDKCSLSANSGHWLPRPDFDL